jgi:opacity protein-like surface antigen
MRKTFLLFFVVAASAMAQSFGVGIKAGVPLNDALNVKPAGAIQYVQDTHRYAIGPYIEFRLPAQFSVELDALYRSYEYRQTIPGGQNVSASAWEFPLLAKKSLFGGPIQPYVEGGVALSHLSVDDVLELNHRNNYGIVLGAGLSLHLAGLRIAPEVRYNGWAFRNFTSPGGFLQSNRNQASFLIGIGF